LLERETDIEVLEGAGTLAEALATELEPDVIVAELILPGCQRSEFLKTLRERFPAAAILMLTAARTPADVYGALADGANGYLLKEADPSELITAVRRVAGGGQHLGPRMMALLAPAPDRLDGLTRREVEVVHLLVAGHLNHEIARILHLSVRTVEHHRSNLLGKLGVRTRAELVRFVSEPGPPSKDRPVGIRPNLS
jgi:two-component system response regulator NreC